jgi:hypothetical protein
MKNIGLTVLFCLAATSAFAQDPEPASPEPPPSVAPVAWTPPISSPINSPSMESSRHDRRSGFHIAIGTGFAGGGEQGRPGIASQFKIGYRLDADWVITTTR